MPTFSRRIVFAFSIVLAGFGATLRADEPVDNHAESSDGWHVGIAKVDITPREPVRMAGYGNRDRSSEAVDLPLAVRCMTLRPGGESADPYLLISIDTIGLPASLSRQINARIETDHGIGRERIVLCSTHTHCAPDLVSELSNIFAVPMTDAEREAGLRYRAGLVDAVVKAAEVAIADLSPAVIGYAVGSAGFATNRRMIVDGRWTGFGANSDGAVDHSLPVLRITSPDGTLRGVVFNYACHNTTLTGAHYGIGGDWSGFASQSVESQHPGTVALSTIGCGADADPQPRGSLQAAIQHGQTLADEIERLIGSDMRPISAKVEARVDHAALSFELPTIEEVRARMDDANPQVARHAAMLDQTYRDEGRLPATYPVPIQSWRLGDDLTMIFLGGEVVVDYALRLKRELADDTLWVTAYAGDVLGYIASERVRREGGYEFDASGVYYGLAGPWAAGTEDHFVAQIIEMLRSETSRSPVSADKAVATMRLSSDDYAIELVAAEPLVQDPVNLAFGPDGRLWVVEMGDYPTGDRGGQVKYLTDTDGDGRYDRATVFLDQLSFPTGVLPWRDGVLISVAPDILMARDTTGDGVADSVEKLFTGFSLANPQHRVAGFTYGLDHSLHLSSGDNQGELTSVLTGQVVNASGHDVQIWPDRGEIATTSGRTQFIRSRDDFGRWFGNENSLPLYHYPIDAKHFRRNPAVAYSDNAQQLFDPPVAPPVFPATSAAVRYNDLYAANRFTSACGAIVARSPDFWIDGGPSALICEPVHNLVHRAALLADGATYRAGRGPLETAAEFLASTDPWFRPVRCEIGPDGAVWVVDMYRETIEHPEWIPEAWKAQLDLTAGSDRGRIYRIVAKRDAATATGGPVTRIDQLTTRQWVDSLRSPSGKMRDMAQQALIERATASPRSAGSPSGLDSATIDALRALAIDASVPAGRVHALAVLDLIGHGDDALVLTALESDDPGLVYFAAGLSHGRLSSGDDDSNAVMRRNAFLDRFGKLASHADPQVVLAVGIAMGETDAPAAGKILAEIASRDDLDRWTSVAILTSAAHHAKTVLSELLAIDADRGGPVEPFSAAKLQLIAGLLDTAVAGNQDVTEMLRQTFADAGVGEAQKNGDDDAIDAKLSLAISVAESFTKVGVDPGDVLSLITPLYRRGIAIAVDASQPESRRCRAIELFGRGIAEDKSGDEDRNGDDATQERELLVSLMSPAVPPRVQRHAVDALARIDHLFLVDTSIERWPSMSSSLRDHCVNRMLSRPSSINRLLSAIEGGTISVNELTAAARQQLLHSGSRSMMVRAQRLIESSGGGAVDKQRLVERYLNEFASDMAAGSEIAASEVAGGATEIDSHDGAALFAKHCGACHTPDDQGRTIGPSLANLTDRRDRSLVESVLDPNRAVEPRFQSYLIRTEDDEILVGGIENELAETITLARADGTRILVDRRRIAEMKNSGVSLMPAGFEALLTPQQLRAVVRHIQNR